MWFPLRKELPGQTRPCPAPEDPPSCGLTSGTAVASSTALHSPLQGHQEVGGPLSRREHWGRRGASLPLRQDWRSPAGLVETGRMEPSLEDYRNSKVLEALWFAFFFRLFSAIIQFLLCFVLIRETV